MTQGQQWTLSARLTRHRFLALSIWLKAKWQWLRFGDITEKVMATAGDGIVAEIEFRGRGDKVVGYWAYGSFDPHLPFQG
jgi:hypothetical protein